MKSLDVLPPFGAEHINSFCYIAGAASLLLFLWPPKIRVSASLSNAFVIHANPIDARATPLHTTYEDDLVGGNDDKC